MASAFIARNIDGKTEVNDYEDGGQRVTRMAFSCQARCFHISPEYVLGSSPTTGDAARVFFSRECKIGCSNTPGMANASMRAGWWSVRVVG